MAIGVPFNLFAPSLIGASGQAISTTADSPVGNLIVIFTATPNSGVSTTGVTDSTSVNIYHQAAQSSPSANVNSGIFYSIQTADLPSGGSIYVAYSGGGNLGVYAVSVSGVLSFNVGNSNYSNSNVTSATVVTGSLATSNEIVFAGMELYVGILGTYNEASGFTQLVSGSQSGGADYVYKVVSSTNSVTYNPTWTAGDATTYSACIAAFSGASAVTAVPRSQTLIAM